jgi:hypothetical protein
MRFLVYLKFSAIERRSNTQALARRAIEMSNQNQFGFLFPRSRYRGNVRPENLVFNANLQEFAQRVGYISNLETGGKLTPEESYKEIKALWKELKRSKKSLGIGKVSPFHDENGPEAEAS